MDADIQICKKPEVKQVQINVKLEQPVYNRGDLVVKYQYPITGDLVMCPHCGEHCRSPGNTPCHGIEPFSAYKNLLR